MIKLNLLKIFIEIFEIFSFSSKHKMNILKLMSSKFLISIIFKSKIVFKTENFEIYS